MLGGLREEQRPPGVLTRPLEVGGAYVPAFETVLDAAGPVAPEASRRTWVAVARAYVERDSLLSNSIGVMVSSGLTAVLGYAYWTLAARALSAEQVGVASALIPAMTLAALVVAQGWVATLIAELPRRKDPGAWSSLVRSSLVTSIAGGLASAVLALVGIATLAPRMLPGGLFSPLAGMFLLGSMATAAHLVLDAALVAARSGGRMAVRAGFASLLKLPLLAAFALAVFSGHLSAPLAILGSWVLATTVSVLLGAVVLIPRALPGASLLGAGRGDVSCLRRSFAHNHFGGLGGMLPSYVLPPLIAGLLGPAEAAYFYLTWMVGSAFFLVSPAVSSALLAEGAHDPSGLSRAVARSAKISMVLLSVPAAITVVFAGRILSLFGADYAAHARLLLIVLVLSVVPDAVTNLAIASLRVRGRLALASVLNIGMAGTCLVLAWLLIPRVGITGGGAAWLAAQTLGALTVLVALLTPVRRVQREVSL